MTAKELREMLAQVPADAVIIREGGEYSGDYRYVEHAVYTPHVTFGAPRNTVKLS